MAGQVNVSGGRIRTPAGSAPVIPVILIGSGAYLMWFSVRYWRGQGPAVWPSYPVKSILQGHGIPGPQQAATPTAQLTAYEQTLAAAQDSSQGGSVGSGPAVPRNATEDFVIRAILTALGAPRTPANIGSMAAWIRRETPWPPVARYNPMNTTLPAQGATDFNSVGVKNYRNFGQGIAATVATLRGGYPNIVAALRSGKGLCGNPSTSGDFSKWSGGGYSSVC